MWAWAVNLSEEFLLLLPLSCFFPFLTHHCSPIAVTQLSMLPHRAIFNPFHPQVGFHQPASPKQCHWSWGEVASLLRSCSLLGDPFASPAMNTGFGEEPQLRQCHVPQCSFPTSPVLPAFRKAETITKFHKPKSKTQNSC